MIYMYNLYASIYIPVYLFLCPVSADPPTVVTSLTTDADDGGMFCTVSYLILIYAVQSIKGS